MRWSGDSSRLNADDGQQPLGGLDLQVSNLTKQFGQTVALDGLSLSVAAGDVHAVLGENGAGKSTLVKLLSGLVAPNTGDVKLNGETAVIASPRVAHGFGIRTAFQEISLVRDLTVTQNFLLMEEPLDWLGTIRRRQSEELVRAQLAELGLAAVDPRMTVSRIDLPTRQKIEIARAVSRGPRLLILDEPTASLSARDVAWLGGMIDRVKARGTTVILISHRMQDVRDFCSKLTVLRNGAAVGTHKVDDLSDEDVIELMIGRSIDAVFPHRPAATAAQASPIFEARDFAAEGVGPVSFGIRPGEILGVAALQGMGQRELFLGLFGARPRLSGSIAVNGETRDIRSPADAIQWDIGIGLIPEDRKTEGLFLDLDGRENATLPSLRDNQHFGIINSDGERRSVAAMFARVNLSSRAIWSPVRQLSGGNQQKVILAKWLLSGGRIMLFYDPTRGVDIGTKAEIYRLMRDFANSGGAVLFYSTDITELVNLCDAAIVLYRGRLAETLATKNLTDTNIMRAAVGQGTAERTERSGDALH